MVGELEKSCSLRLNGDTATGELPTVESLTAEFLTLLQRRNMVYRKEINDKDNKEKEVWKAYPDFSRDPHVSNYMYPAEEKHGAGETKEAATNRSTTGY